MAFGILQPNDYYGEVTGTVIMMSGKAPAQTSKDQSTNIPDDIEENHQDDGLKRTANGIVLHPQPHNDPNDPLNWPIWKRDIALGVIGFQSFIIGGMSPLLAAAFTIMSEEFNVSQSTLAYLVGAYMLSMGVGSVFFAPTAVLYGKRLVYIIALVLFLVGCIIGGASNSFQMLLGARIIMGVGGSPTESLPSASIAEIYFLHERAYRLGIYTLLMLGGKNLVPMVAGFVIGDIGWNWVFWILALIAGMNLLLTFFFVPETWWDRTPIPNKRSIKETELALEARANSLVSRVSSSRFESNIPTPSLPVSTADALRIRNQLTPRNPSYRYSSSTVPRHNIEEESTDATIDGDLNGVKSSLHKRQSSHNDIIQENPNRTNLINDTAGDYFEGFSSHSTSHSTSNSINNDNNEDSNPPQPVRRPTFAPDVEIVPNHSHEDNTPTNPTSRKSYLKQLSLWNGRFTNDKWWMVALRPFFLYCYPGILFSTFIYSFSVVWLIVISETISKIFSAEPYNFPTTSVGLLYIATFIGGCLGSAVAGKASDFIVRTLSRKNGGTYEPEYRIIMIIPVFLAVTIGMMGFGWSSFEKDLWIVPAIFLSIIGFGCSLGSTTAITYAVDSYKMFAAEALVSLNLSKNVIGFLFSLFVPEFLAAHGPRTVFVVFGSVQIFICLWAIPIYIFGKRIRHWTDNVDIIKSLYTLDDDDDDEKDFENNHEHTK